MSDLAKELFAAGRLVARAKAKYMKAMLLAFAPVEVEGLGTIGVTEHGVLIIDWSFIDEVIAMCKGDMEKAARQIAGLLVHECFHVILNHCKRSRGKDPQLSNEADDMSFNPAIFDMGLELPTGHLAPCLPTDHGWERGLTSDEYYARLKAKQEAQPKPKKGKGGGGQQGQPMPGQGEPGQGQGEASQGQGAGQGQPGSGSATGQPKSGKRPKTGGGWCGGCAGNPFPNEPAGSEKPSRSKADLDRAARAVAAAVREEASSGRGTVPGFLQRWADEMLAPAEIPWEQELSSLCRTALAWKANAVDHRYDAPSRKQAGIGFGAGRPVLPRFRAPIPNVVVILDTSGSMGTDELSIAGRETAGILKSLGADVTFITCDTTVHGVTKVRSLKEMLAALKGGGGTSMTPAFAEVMKLRPRPEVIVCLTDLHIGDPGPEPLGTKTVWVGIGEHAGPDPKWGKTVRVTKDKINNSLKRSAS